MSAAVTFDFSGVDLFLDWWNGHAAAEDVLLHPAYRAVTEHARRYASGLTARDLDDARAGRPSAFYGLGGLDERLSQVRTLLVTIRDRAAEWSRIIAGELDYLAPAPGPVIVVRPIIGYDMGIGLGETACLNLNHRAYQDDPDELLFFAIHECVHVLYERTHPVPTLRTVVTPGQWRSYFNMWLQNEGFAVHAPVRLRTAYGKLAHSDYRVLADPALLEQHRRALLDTMEALRRDRAQTRNDYLTACFGPMRLTYRMGCELLRRLEAAAGRAALAKAFSLDADRFVAAHRYLLERPSSPQAAQRESAVPGG